MRWTQSFSRGKPCQSCLHSFWEPLGGPLGILLVTSEPSDIEYYTLQFGRRPTGSPPLTYLHM
jgi:hypothetical protein